MNSENYNREKYNKVTLAIFERQNHLIDKYQEVKTLSKEDIESGVYPNFAEGQQIKINPAIPNNPKDSFQLFKDFYAAFQCETHKSIFFDTYRSFENENAISAEIKVLQDFIKMADAINYFDACKNFNNPDRHYEYKRLTCDFYDDYLMTWEQHNLNSSAAAVYGKYVLFYEFLKKILIGNNKLSKIHLITTHNNLGFDRINIEPKTNNLPVEIYSIYQPDYKNETARFTEFVGEDISFVIEGNIMKRFLKNVENGRFYNNQLEILNIKTIQHFFKFFSRGFLEGYFDFDKIINNQTAIFKNDFKSVANKVFEFISNPWDGFTICLKFSNRSFLDIIEEETMIESGVGAGHYYKAWYYVINNPQYFSELFKNHAPFISHYELALKYWEKEPLGKSTYLSLKELLESIKLTEGNNVEAQPKEKNEKELTLNQIALIYFYNGKSITRVNGDEIAKKYRHRTGEGLFQKYTYYSKFANRTGEPKSPTIKKYKNKIELFESIINLVEIPETKQKVLDELKIIRTNFKEFE